jgi:outer membrane protein assembly factor BamB
MVKNRVLLQKITLHPQWEALMRHRPNFTVLICLFTAFFVAQVPNEARSQAPPPLSPEAKADSDALRALAKATPLLPMKRVVLTINPPVTLGLVSAVTADKQGNIYILHRPEDPKMDPVIVVDAKGNRLRSFGAGMFKIPHGIRIDNAGNVWVVDANLSSVTKFTPDGKKLMAFEVGDIPDPSRPFCGASDVAFAANGHLFISDGYCNTRVLEYEADGKRLNMWGGSGKGPGEFNLVHDIALSADGILYVADRENGRVQWFDMKGKWLGEKHFGGQLFSVATAPSGEVYVGTHALGVDFDQDSVIFKFDPKSGKILGRVDGMAHQLGLGADGSLYPGTGAVHLDANKPMGGILIYRP